MRKSTRLPSASRNTLNWRASFVRLRTSAAMAGISALVVGTTILPRAQAANTDLYWDQNGATTGIGGTGAWDTTSLFWSTDSTGASATTAYNNTTPSTVTAHFGGTNGTVTIATGVAINVNSLAFDLTGGGFTGYTIAGGAGSTLNLSGTTPTIVSNFGTQETITAAITGTAGFTETNATTSGSNSATSAKGYALRLQGDLSGLTGTVNVGNGNTTTGGGYIALGTGTANYTSSQYQTWNIAANGLLTSNNQGTGYTYSLGALTGSGILRGGSTNGGTASGTDTFQIGALNTNTTFSGTIVDRGAPALTALTKAGTGTLTLTGLNTFTGATNVSGGTLELGTGGGLYSLGTVAGVINVNSGGTMKFSRNDAIGGSNIATIPVNVTVTGGTLTNTTGYYTSITNANFNGATITDNGGPSTGYSAFRLGGTVTVTGTTATNINIGTATASNGINLGTAGGANDATTFNVGTAASLNVNDVLRDSGGSLNGLTKTGAGTMTLAAQNTFSGPVIVNGGTLIVAAIGADDGSAGALGLSNTAKSITVNSGATLSGTLYNWFGNPSNADAKLPAITVNGGILSTTRYTTIGTLNLNGATVTNSSTETSSSYQAFAFRGGVTVGGTSASTISAAAATGTTQGYHLGANTLFTVNDAVTGTDLTVSAPLRDQSGDFANAVGGFTKAGLGAMTLSALNTYTGTTTVNAGTLALAAGGGAAAVLGPVTVNSGATLSLTATDALGYTSGTTTGTLTVNGGTVDNAVGGNQGFLTKFNLTGATVTSTGSGPFFFGSTDSSVGITSNASATTSVISAPLVGRNSPLTFTVAKGSTASGVDLSVTGVVNDYVGTEGIIKAGAGTLVLTATNLYDGPTVVNAGNLIVTGSTKATSAVTVTNTGSILSGTGTVAGTVTVGNGAIISAGNKGAATPIPGTLTTGALTLQTGSTFDALLASGTSFSTLSASGTTNLANAAFSISLVSGATFTNGQVLTLITSSVSNQFTNSVFTTGGYTFTADYTTHAGFFDVDVMTAVPEPATWLAGGLLVGLAGVSQRRRFSGLLTSVRS